MNSLTRTKIIAYIVATFLAGAVAGGVGGYSIGKIHPVIMPKPRDMADGISSHLGSRLGLTTEQLAKIKPIIEGACQEVQARSREQRKEISQRFEKMDLEISALLTSAQNDEFAKMQQERRDSMGKHSHPRPPPETSSDKTGSNCPPPGGRR
jgi:hypothetical protein